MLKKTWTNDKIVNEYPKNIEIAEIFKKCRR
jgi:hypothetical protein